MSVRDERSQGDSSLHSCVDLTCRKTREHILNWICWLKLAVITRLLFDHGLVSVEGSFRIVNLCGTPVWVASQSNAGQPILPGASVSLNPSASTIISAPPGWGGRFWGRTGCTFDNTGRGTCITGDCGGTLQCTGVGGDPPATLAEFTLNGAAGKDYYDVSLVDGYNLPVAVAATSFSSGSDDDTVIAASSFSDSSSNVASCGVAGCTGDLNRNCPQELQVLGDGGQVMACKSACDAFGSAAYCCTGAFSSPSTCMPTSFSQTFKMACPNAYSYAYDDASSIFTCNGGSYTITFCPQGSLIEAQSSTPSNSSAERFPSWLPTSAHPRTQQQGPYLKSFDSSSCSNTYSRNFIIIFMATLFFFKSMVLC